MILFRAPGTIVKYVGREGVGCRHCVTWEVYRIQQHKDILEDKIIVVICLLRLGMLLSFPGVASALHPVDRGERHRGPLRHLHGRLPPPTRNGERATNVTCASLARKTSKFVSTASAAALPCFTVLIAFAQERGNGEASHGAKGICLNDVRIG